LFKKFSSLRENRRLLCVPIFAVRFISGARQREHFAVRFWWRTSNNLCRAFYFLAHSKECLLCILFLGAWQTFFIPLCRVFPSGAHGKHIPFSCIFLKCTTKCFLKKWFLFFFLFVQTKTLFLYSTFQFYTCLYKFTIFKNYVSFKEFLLYTTNLNCKCIK
jgi:hypothetical protein